jgi:hypothetical protein
LNTRPLSSVKSSLLKNHSSVLLLLIPLAVSAFTHYWNPIGFPSFWYVEEIYLQRAMYVLHGLGVVDPLTTYGHPYDHPYFGQLLLAGLLKIINYPDSLNLSSFTTSSYSIDDSTRNLVYSVNILHLVPRHFIRAHAYNMADEEDIVGKSCSTSFTFINPVRDLLQEKFNESSFQN